MFRKLIAHTREDMITFECRSLRLYDWYAELPEELCSANAFLNEIFRPVVGAEQQVAIPVYSSLRGVFHYCLNYDVPRDAARAMALSTLTASPLFFEALRSGWSQYVAVPLAILGQRRAIADMWRTVPVFLAQLSEMHSRWARYSPETGSIYLSAGIEREKASVGSILVHEAVHHLDAVSLIAPFASYYLATGLDLVYSLLREEYIDFGEEHGDRNYESFLLGCAYAALVNGDGAALTSRDLFKARRMLKEIDMMNTGSFRFSWSPSSGYEEAYMHGMFYGGINRGLLKSGASMDELACLARAMVMKKPLEDTLKAIVG